MCCESEAAKLNGVGELRSESKASLADIGLINI